MKASIILRINRYVIVFFLSSLVQKLYAQPTVTSFSPASGPIGTTVTIYGTNFDPDAGSHIVYFGAVRAVVFSAASDSLLVKVPVGATFQPITVTNNHLVASSAKPFYVTFSGSDVFESTSFTSRTDFSTGNYPRSITASDFDGDGMTDLAVVNNNSASVSVFRNSGTVETIAFASKVDYPTGDTPMDIASGDLNGDGKPDFVVGNISSNTVSVFINQSPTGDIVMAQKTDYATADNPVSVSIGDVNNDGKPDIIALNLNSNSVSVLLNTTPINGTISFASKIDFEVGEWPQDATTGDIDGDGKLDIVVANHNANTISVLRNTSVSQSVSFATKIDYNSGTNPFHLAIGDLDGNLTPEVLVSNSNSNTISVFNNTSSPGTISLTKSDFATRNLPLGISIGNLDGNTKPDIVVADFGAETISLFNNTTEANSIIFQSGVALPTGRSPRGVAIGDYDGDGKQDLAAANSNSNNISVFRNRIGETYKADLCPGGGTQITTTVTASYYQWQVNKGDGFSNINDDTNYTGTLSQTLQLSNVPSSWYGYQYRCLSNASASEITSLRFIYGWKGSFSNEWANPSNWNCGSVPDANSDVVISHGSVVLSANASCRSLKVNPGASFSVSPGYILTITKAGPPLQ